MTIRQVFTTCIIFVADSQHIAVAVPMTVIQVMRTRMKSDNASALKAT
jgi:hypothetical protein